MVKQVQQLLSQELKIKWHSAQKTAQYKELRFNKVINNSVVKSLGFINNWLVLLPLFSGISEVLVWGKHDFLSCLVPKLSGTLNMRSESNICLLRVVSSWLSYAFCFIHDMHSEKHLDFSHWYECKMSSPKSIGFRRPLPLWIHWLFLLSFTASVFYI